MQNSIFVHWNSSESNLMVGIGYMMLSYGHIAFDLLVLTISNQREYSLPASPTMTRIPYENPAYLPDESERSSVGE